MSEESLPADALPEYAERVLEVAELIPPGRVMTYGDVAEWLEEGGPRQVGRVMALYGGPCRGGASCARTACCCPATSCAPWTTTARRARPCARRARAAEGHVPRLDMRRARWDGGERAAGSHLTASGHRRPGATAGPYGGRGARPWHAVRSGTRDACRASRGTSGRLLPHRRSA